MLASKNTIIFVVSITIISFIGILGLLFATSWGIGIAPDSTIYIGTARNLLRGNGLTVPSLIDGTTMGLTPFVQFPPLYPVLLSLPGLFGIDPALTARWLNVIMFGANIFLIGFLINKCTGRSLWVPILASIYVMTSTAVIHIHTQALSEPLFIFLGFFGLFILASYLKKEEIPLLVISSIAISLALLTRYAGVSLIGTGIIGLLLFGQRPCRKKISDIFFFMSITLIPNILWIVRNIILTGHASNRKAGFHSLGLINILQAMDTFSLWLLPSVLSFKLRIFFLSFFASGVILCGYLLLYNHNKKSGRTHPSISKILFDMPPFVGMLIIFIVVYSGLLVANIFFVDATAPLFYRLLSPLHISLFMLVVLLLKNYISIAKSRWGFFIIAICIFFILSISFLRGINKIMTNHNDGIAYASKTWVTSNLLEKIKDIPNNVPIYSNERSAIYFYNDKLVFDIPPKKGTYQKNNRFRWRMMRRNMENKNGIIVFFYKGESAFRPNKEELRKSLPLRVLFENREGTIFGIKR